MNKTIHYQTELVRDQPYQLRYYPSIDLSEVYSPLLEHNPLPEKNQKLVREVQDSIDKYGMLNPIIVEWFGPYFDDHDKPRWSVRVGNNRFMACRGLGVTHCAALVIVPDDGQTRPALSGGYEALNFMDALTLFDASHPWWHSYILRLYRPDLVPPAA